MNPETFHDLLDRATQTAPPVGPGSELTAGRARLRRRRLSAAAGGALATVIVVGGAFVVTTGSGPGHAADPVATAPAEGDDAALLDSCRQGNQSRKATAALFGAGTPLVKSVVSTDYEIVAALESADGKHWAECWVHLLSAEFASGMTVYPSDASVQDEGSSSEGTSYTVGPGCGLVDNTLAPSCGTWFVEWVDRLPEAVTSVKFDLRDGTTETVPSRGGYVVLNTLHPLGGEVSYDAHDGLVVDTAITRVTYLDASGTALASEGPSPRGGLPPLSAYPSERGAAIS